MTTIKKIKRNIFLVPILLIGVVFGIAATNVYSNVNNVYEFRGMKLTDFSCPVLVSAKVSKNISFNLSSKSSEKYEIVFSSTISCTSLGMSVTKQTISYKITATAQKITVPFQCIENADNYDFTITYSLKNDVVTSTLFKVNLNPYNTRNYNSDDTKIIELTNIFLTLRNGVFRVTGLYFNFSYIRYDLLNDLPYGKIPLKCFKMILKENKYSNAIIYSSQFTPSVLFGVGLDFDSPINGNDVFMYSRDEKLIASTDYALFKLTQNSKSNSDVVTFSLTNTFFLVESTNAMWSTKKGTDNGNHVYDIYLDYRYQKYYKGRRKCMLYFNDPTTHFYLYYVIPFEFNDESYKNVEIVPEVIGEFKENEKKVNKIIKL